MSTMASQIISVSSIYSAVGSNADRRKHQSSVSLALVRGIHRSSANSPHKGPVTRKCLCLMTSSWRHHMPTWAPSMPLRMRGMSVWLFPHCLLTSLLRLTAVKWSWTRWRYCHDRSLWLEGQIQWFGSITSLISGEFCRIYYPKSSYQQMHVFVQEKMLMKLTTSCMGNNGYCRDGNAVWTADFFVPESGQTCRFLATLWVSISKL